MTVATKNKRSKHEQTRTTRKVHSMVTEPKFAMTGFIGSLLPPSGSCCCVNGFACVSVMCACVVPDAAVVFEGAGSLLTLQAELDGSRVVLFLDTCTSICACARTHAHRHTKTKADMTGLVVETLPTCCSLEVGFKATMWAS